jgi:hypothetical protein
VIVAAFISDRADQYLPDCRATFEQRIVGDIHATTIIDDRDHRLGLAGAARAAWEWALDTGADYLIHIEEDFTFVAPVELDHMRILLDRHPHLAQIVLKRQPAPTSPEELAAGGIIEQDPDAYTQWHDGHRSWVEHRKIFSLNPCLIPRHVLELGWPDGNEAEFTQTCLGKGYRFAFYGHRADPPRVMHHGVRSQGWKP